MNLANNIRNLRKKRGWSQTDLANATRTTLSNINKIETGKYVPSLEILLKLADVLEVTLDQLVNGDGEFSEVRVEDKSLAQRIRMLDSLSDDDRKFVIRMLDIVLTNQKIMSLLNKKTDFDENDEAAIRGRSKTKIAKNG